MIFFENSLSTILLLGIPVYCTAPFVFVKNDVT
jgi:hypothetical protein